MELDDILGETPESAPVADEVVETTEVETPEVSEGPARDEHGRFIPKGEEPAPVAEAAPPAVQEVEHSPPPGLIEERRKRQETEQRAQQLAARVQQLEQAQQPIQPEPYFPSVYEDEAGFTAALQQQAAQLAQQQLMPQVQQQIQQVQINFSRQMMATANPDFLETEAAFFQMAEQNPVLYQEMQRQPDPVRFAYDYAKKAAEVAKIGSLDIAAIKAAAIAEFQATQQQAAAAPQAQQLIPTSLADQQSARLTGAGAPTGPPSLDQILGR